MTPIEALDLLEDFVIETGTDRPELRLAIATLDRLRQEHNSIETFMSLRKAMRHE